MIDEQRQKDLVTLIEEKKVFQQLLEHPGWCKLVGIIQDQVDNLQTQALFRPLKSMDEVLEQEFTKGRIEGRLSLTGTIETLLEEYDASIDQLRGEEDGPGTE